MRSPKTLVVLSVVLVILLSFNRIEKKATLDLKQVNVMELLTEQEFGTRPTHDYMFYVKTDIETLAENQIVNAKVYVLNRKTNQESLIAQENLKLTDFRSIDGMNTESIQNLAKTNTLYETPYNFYELLQFEPIYRNFVDSTKKLL